MNKIKNILKICIILSTIILVGTIFQSNSKATYPTINGKEYKTHDSLAALAENDPATFINADATELFGSTDNLNILQHYDFTPGNRDYLRHRTIMCANHRASNENFENTSNMFRIANVVDIRYSPTEGKNIVINNGNPAYTEAENIAKLGFAAWYASINGATSNSGSGGKEAVLTYTRQAVENGELNLNAGFTEDTVNTGNDNSYLLATSTLSDAQTYWNNIKNYKAVTKNNNDSDVKVEEYESMPGTTVLGPFNVEYNGKGIESVTLTATDTEGNKKEIKDITFSKYIGKEQVWSNNWKYVPNQEDFYIKIDGTEYLSYQGFEVTIKQQELKIYKARLIFTITTHKRDQQLVIYTGLEEKYNGEVKYEITSEPKKEEPITISGNVWAKVQDTKNNKYYETPVSGVNVKLMNSNGTEVKNENGTNSGYVATTNSDGYYEFTGTVLDTDVRKQKYYVEFDYSGTEYSKYNIEEYNATSEKGSRADKAIGGGKAQTTAGKLANALSNFYNSEKRQIEHVNLRLITLPVEDGMLEENIKKVDISINGYTYTYNYGSTGDVTLSGTPSVSWQGKADPSAYTRYIYPSDVKYSLNTNNSGRIAIDVTYRIDITNTTDVSAEENSENEYDEIGLVVEQLANSFDDTRYTLNDSNWEMHSDGKAYYKYPEKIVSKQPVAKKTFKHNGNGTVTTNKESYNNVLGSKDVAEPINITFSIKGTALDNMLESIMRAKETGVMERLDFPTTAHMDFHHIGRTRYSESYSHSNDGYYDTREYDDDGNVISGSAGYYPCYGHDTEKFWHEKVTDKEESKDSAPYLIFKLGEERTIEGTVFEDNIDDNRSVNGRVLGNGIYDNGENGVGEVKVELMNADGTTVARIYPKDTTKSDGEEATTTSNTDGTFTIKGIVPGDYYLRYTYSDGTIRIGGNPVSQGNSYKSTIITSQIVRNAFSANTESTKWTWYKDLDQQYSLAKDDLAQKAEYYKGNRSDAYAQTPKMSITIESTKNSDMTITSQGQTPTYTFKGLNFGIIRQPRSTVDLEKVISDVKFVNIQNNVVSEGNPSTEKLPGVTDLGKTSYKNQVYGSTFVRSELSEDEIYGTTLMLTYTIKVINVSDTNYYGENYYWYGESENYPQVKIKVEEVLDYLDEELNFKAASVSYEIGSKNQIMLEDEELKCIEITLSDIDAVIATNKDENNTDTCVDIKLGAQVVTSSDFEDLEFTNAVKASKLSKANYNGDYDNDILPNIVLKPDVPNVIKKAKITITPPTGKDMQTIVIYTAATVVGLIIISAGIIIIKKKVLK